MTAVGWFIIIKMSQRYNITKAIHRHEYDSIHPCQYRAEGCDMVGYITREARYWIVYKLTDEQANNMSHHTCPDHAKRLEEMLK